MNKHELIDAINRGGDDVSMSISRDILERMNYTQHIHNDKIVDRDKIKAAFKRAVRKQKVVPQSVQPKQSSQPKKTVQPKRAITPKQPSQSKRTVTPKRAVQPKETVQPATSKHNVESCQCPSAADRYPVIQAALFYTPTDLQKLLASNNHNINQKNEFGETALHYAVYFGNVDAVSLLIEYGANKSVRNKQNKTPLELLYDVRKNSSVYECSDYIKQKDMCIYTFNIIEQLLS